MKRVRSSDAVLASLPVETNGACAAPLIRPRTPSLHGGDGKVRAIDDDAIARAKRSRLGFTPKSSSEADERLRDMARDAARASGEVELLRMIDTLPFPLNEREELALVELNVLMRVHRESLPRLRLRASHSWTKADPRRVVDLVADAIPRNPRVAHLLRHLARVAFPDAVAAHAAHHVFDVPPWLKSWCARNPGGAGAASAAGRGAAFSGEGGEAPAALVVSVVEFTMYEARGHASNALYFPLFDER